MSARAPIHLSRFAAAALLACAAAAFAVPPYERFAVADADATPSREYARCMDRSGGVTVAMRDCAGSEHERLDRRLNAAYRAAMARLPDGAARTRLRNLERRWLAVRWSRCRRDADAEGGGTLALLILDSCTLDEMVRRVVWLERYGR
jgi:uncharacterized protein YecT (DUF1311 family)